MKRWIYMFCCISSFLYANTQDPTILKRVCEKQGGQACHLLGRMYRDGDHVERDYQKAMQYFQKACDSKFALGCSFIGGMYYEGIGVEQNNEKSKIFYQKACDYGLKSVCGLPESCNNSYIDPIRF